MPIDTTSKYIQDPNNPYASIPNPNYVAPTSIPTSSTLEGIEKQVSAIREKTGVLTEEVKKATKTPESNLSWQGLSSPGTTNIPVYSSEYANNILDGVKSKTNNIVIPEEKGVENWQSILQVRNNMLGRICDSCANKKRNSR